MDYKPRYAQPFSLKEAVLLDVSTLTEEIARLQNSLQRLQETQVILRDYIASESPEEVDPEFTQAVEENEVVIGSQEERIGILKLALAEKGVLTSSHYDLAPLQGNPTRESSRVTGVTSLVDHDEPDDGGVHL